MKNINYIRVKSIGLFQKRFAYIDTKNYVADDVFVQDAVSVCFDGECANPNEKYIVVFCKVKNRDADKFFSSMEKLSRKMLLFGNTDYYSECERLLKIMKG